MRCIDVNAPQMQTLDSRNASPSWWSSTLDSCSSSWFFRRDGRSGATADGIGGGDPAVPQPSDGVVVSGTTAASRDDAAGPALRGVPQSTDKVDGVDRRRLEKSRVGGGHGSAAPERTDLSTDVPPPAAVELFAEQPVNETIITCVLYLRSIPSQVSGALWRIVLKK